MSGEKHCDGLMCQAESRDECNNDAHWTPEPSEVAETTAGERCPKSWCAAAMPHAHTTATASMLSVDEASRLYQEALNDYEDALMSCDPDRRASAEVRLRGCAAALSGAQSRRVMARSGAAPTWNALLSDPTQQLDSEGVVAASVLTPFEPDAGEVSEGLRALLNRLLTEEYGEERWGELRSLERIERAVLASPWLAAHVSAAETKARADERERIAQAIEAYRDTHRWSDTPLADAASIARGDAR